MFKELFDQKKLIIFDLDGTIIKSESVWDLTFKEVAKALGVNVDTTGTAGNTVEERWKYITVENDLKLSQSSAELIELTHQEFVKHLDKLELTEGFWPFVGELKLIKKLNLALVTNTFRFVTEKVMEQLELKEVFDFVICGDEVKNPKPHPEIYKKALAHYKLRPKEVLVFEDSLAGCNSAAKAGIEIICVWDGETSQNKFPDEVKEFTNDFTPFPGEMDTTYYEDIKQMAKEQEATTLKTE